MVGGGVEMVGGGALIVGGSVSLVGPVVGTVVSVHGADTLQAGFWQFWTGDHIRNSTAEGITYLTGSELAGDIGDAAIGFTDIGASAPSLLTRTKCLTRVSASGDVVRAAGKTTDTVENLAEASRILDDIPSSPFRATALVPKAPYELGRWGEARLAQDLGNVGAKPSSAFHTSRGNRFVDRLVGGVAHEAKSGVNVGLTSRVREQILKDSELIARGRIQGAHWHFYQGAQQDVLDFLIESGITYTVH
jgi:hypothetical protein